MKTKLLLVCVLALSLLVMTFGGCGGAQNDADNTTTTTTTSTDANTGEQGSEGGMSENTQTVGAVTFTEMGEVKGKPTFYSGGILTESVDDGVRVLDRNGNAVLQTVYDDIDSLVDNGIVIVTKTDASGNVRTGVVDSYNGVELVPCEAVNVRWLSDRYLMIGYLTEESTADDYFDFYYVNSETHYYKGYGQVLDLQTGKMVPNVKVTESYYDISAAGNMIAVDAAYPNTDVYNAEGEKVGTYAYLNVYASSSLFLQADSDVIKVYNSDMEQVGMLHDSIYNYDTIDGVDTMLVHSVTVNNSATVQKLVDLNGSPLSEQYATIEDVYGGAFVCYRDKDEAGNTLLGVDDLEGNAVVPAAYTNVVHDEIGYFIGYTTDGVDVYTTTGERCNRDGAVQTSEDLCFYNDSNHVLILSTGEMVEVESIWGHQDGSLFLSNGSLIDLISGETVMKDVDSCVACGDSLYVWDNDTELYTRYDIRYNSES